MTCTPGQVIDGFVLNVPAQPDQRGSRLGVSGLQTMKLDEQVSSVFGQTTAVGELTSLAEDMFSHEVAEAGLWRPFDFLVEGYAGVYFLEPTGVDGLRFIVTGNTNPGLVEATLTGTTLTLTYRPYQNGTATLTVRATDQQELFVEEVFKIIMNRTFPFTLNRSRLNDMSQRVQPQSN